MSARNLVDNTIESLVRGCIPSQTKQAKKLGFWKLHCIVNIPVAWHDEGEKKWFRYKFYSWYERKFWNKIYECCKKGQVEGLLKFQLRKEIQ